MFKKIISSQHDNNTIVNDRRLRWSYSRVVYVDRRTAYCIVYDRRTQSSYTIIVIRRIFLYTVVYDRAFSTWAITVIRKIFPLRTDWSDVFKIDLKTSIFFLSDLIYENLLDHRPLFQRGELCISRSL